MFFVKFMRKNEQRGVFVLVKRCQGRRKENTASGCA
jgi:hypothetical protein